MSNVSAQYIKAPWRPTFAALTLLLTPPSPAQTVAARPVVARPVVVELYTAQGCSSCPPADALLGELAARPDVLALAFHVDYWDSIGWRDSFAIPQAVLRQRRYIETLKLASAFTPQTIIDGRGSFVGSDRRRIAAAITARSDGIPVMLEIIGADLRVSITETDTHERYDVNLIAYLPRASTAVGRGENGGRVLEEFNIVRQFRDLGAWQGHQAQFQVPLKSLPPDATRVAVLLQRAGQGSIDGATSAALR
jgi:hypothetical protein